MVQDELYGIDTESLNSEEGKLLVESALANIKYNVYKKRKEFLGDHGDDNVRHIKYGVTSRGATQNGRFGITTKEET